MHKILTITVFLSIGMVSSLMGMEENQVTLKESDYKMLVQELAALVILCENRSDTTAYRHFLIKNRSDIKLLFEKATQSDDVFEGALNSYCNSTRHKAKRFRKSIIDQQQLSNDIKKKLSTLGQEEYFNTNLKKNLGNIEDLWKISRIQQLAELRTIIKNYESSSEKKAKLCDSACIYLSGLLSGIGGTGVVCYVSSLIPCLTSMALTSISLSFCLLLNDDETLRCAYPHIKRKETRDIQLNDASKKLMELQFKSPQKMVMER